MTERESCEDCRKLHDFYLKENPKIYPLVYPNGPKDCGTCFPGIHPDNEIICDIYDICFDQVATDGHRAISLNGNFVYETLDRLGVAYEETVELGEEIRSFARSIFQIKNKQADEELKAELAKAGKNNG